MRWFGKLPTYADYYSSPTDEDWAVEFNDWILTGYELYHARQRDANGTVHVSPGTCILRLPKSQMTVFASIQDFGGDMRGRPFPLCFYVGIPSEFCPGPTCDDAPALLKPLERLTEFRERVVRFINSPGRFEQVFGDLELEPATTDTTSGEAAWRQGARKLTMAQWIEASRPCLKADDAEVWLARVAAWGVNISALDSADFEPTFRFPLALSLPLDVQVAGWLNWLGQRMDLTRHLLSLVLSSDADGATGWLSVVAREPIREDFLLWTPLGGALSYVDDLCAAASDGKQQAPTESPSTGMPEQWADFIESAPAT